MCCDWISVNITQQLQQVTVFLHKNALVAPPKQLTVYIATPIEALGINTVYMSHYSR